MQRMAGRLAHGAGTVLVVAGGLLLLAVALMHAYSVYMVAQFPQASVAPAPGGGQPPATAAVPSAPPVGRTLPTYRGPEASTSNAAITGLPGSGVAPGEGPKGVDAVDVGEPAVRIAIPRIGVDAEVVEIGVRLQDGRRVWDPPSHLVGHYDGTANPGETGNIALTGHISSPISSQGSVFKRLPELRLGDRVLLVDAGGRRFLYSVVELRIVPPTEISVLDPTEDQTLTLITCFPDWVYSHRLVVRGTRIPMLSGDDFLSGESS